MHLHHQKHQVRQIRQNPALVPHLTFLVSLAPYATWTVCALCAFAHTFLPYGYPFLPLACQLCNFGYLSCTNNCQQYRSTSSQKCEKHLPVVDNTANLHSQPPDTTPAAVAHGRCETALT